MRYHFMPIKMPAIKKSQKTKNRKEHVCENVEGWLEKEP